jgi:hypothetical protein
MNGISLLFDIPVTLCFCTVNHSSNFHIIVNIFCHTEAN